MNEEQVDRMVRDADPYRPIGHLDGAKQTLLEEIMSELPLERVVQPNRRRRTLFRVAGGVAAGLAVAGILIGTSLLRGRADQTAGPKTYSAAALQAAEGNPRLLIDESGWKATTVYGFAKKDGTVSFKKGKLDLEMNWYDGKYYQDYYKDRLGVSRPEDTKVADWPAAVFTYSNSDFAVMLKPREGTFVEMRTSGTWTRAQFDKVVSHVKRVDAKTWLAALPPEIVTPDRINENAQKVLADVPLPPGFNSDQLAGLGVNDQYQFGAQVTGKVGCSWIREWERAKKAGDKDAQKKAADAMSSSHHWKVLLDMKDEGGWSEVFWEYADKMAAGQEPTGYESGIGCDS
jgi:hypothetical protein